MATRGNLRNELMDFLVKNSSEKAGDRALTFQQLATIQAEETITWYQNNNNQELPSRDSVWNCKDWDKYAKRF